jgi:nickel transport protein
MRQILLLTLLVLVSPTWAHTVDYDVASQQATVVTTHMGDEEASYAEYEVFAPNQKDNPFQIGRSDARGRVVFLPDQPGKWLVKVKADSQHGVHGAEIEVVIDDKSVIKEFSKPLVATHTRLLIGVSLLFGIFGLFSLFRGRGQAIKP